MSIDFWTDEEIKLLINNFETSTTAELLKILPNRTPSGIQWQVGRLGLKRKVKHWTAEEDNIIREKVQEGLTQAEIQKYLPNRTISSVKNRIRNLNLSKPIWWTAEEDAILKEHWPMKAQDYIDKCLLSRTVQSILYRAHGLGLYSPVQNIYEKVNNDYSRLTIIDMVGRRLTYTIDTEDVPKLAPYLWIVSTRNKYSYVFVSPDFEKKKRLDKYKMLTHFLMDIEDEKTKVTFLDKDYTNYRKINLKPCTQAFAAQNTDKPITNTSGEKNVYWVESKKKWKVELRAEGRRIHIGYFKSFQVAKIQAREARAKYQAGSKEAREGVKYD